MWVVGMILCLARDKKRFNDPGGTVVGALIVVVVLAINSFAIPIACSMDSSLLYRFWNSVTLSSSDHRGLVCSGDLVLGFSVVVLVVVDVLVIVVLSGVPFIM